jgi:hypothetical protein
MFIRMTRKALTIKSQKGTPQIILFFRQVRTNDILFIMTGSTFHGGVFSFQNITGLRMVETASSLFPVDKLIIFSLMLDMTDAAIFMIFIGMQTSPGSYFSIEIRMAGQAFFGSELLIESMAFIAVPNPFQRFVISGKISGRKLGRSSRNKSDCQQEKKYHPAHKCPFPKISIYIRS